MLLTKNHIFCRPSWISCHTKENAQHLQVGIHQNWIQHILVDRKQPKTLYMLKNKVVWPGALTVGSRVNARLERLFFAYQNNCIKLNTDRPIL